MGRIRIRLGLMLWLTVLWVALWGDVSIGNVVGGVAVALLIVGIVPSGPSVALTFRPLLAVRFLAWLLWQVTIESFKLAWEVVTPKNSIAMGVVEVELRTSSPDIAALVANCITLTPGTITIEVASHPTRVFVHVLHLHDVEALVASVLDLETKIVAAFGTSDDLAALAANTKEQTS